MSTTIRMQADDFFHAYRVLKESNEKAMNKLFKLAGKPLITQKAFGSLPTMGVTIVCLAFSLELYIKDLYMALNINPPRGRGGHNILKLYEGLPEKTRNEIFSHEAISENPWATRETIFSLKRNPYDGFISRIEAISDGFEKWRYSYESVSL